MARNDGDTMTAVNDAPSGNFLRVFVGATLTAEAILESACRLIKVCPPEGPVSAGPATIMLPPARSMEGRDLIVIDSAKLGFRLVSDGAETFAGNVDAQLSCGLLPLLSDQAGESDGWGVL